MIDYEKVLTINKLFQKDFFYDTNLFWLFTGISVSKFLMLLFITNYKNILKIL